MSAKLFMCLIFLTVVAKGSPKLFYSNKTTEDSNATGNIIPNADKEGMDTANSQSVISYPPYTSYEVTENTIDVPDDRTPAGPIVTNYTHRPPLLNLGRPNNETQSILEVNNVKNKKNRVSILHINAEYDDKFNDIHENKVVAIFKGIKEYVHRFHKGVVHGLHSFFHKHDDLHEHGERFKRAVGKKADSGSLNVDKGEYFVFKEHISIT